MYRLSFLFFLLVFLSSQSYSEEFSPVDCPMLREQVEQLNNKLNSCLTELLSLRAILTERDKTITSMEKSLKNYKEKLAEYEGYIEEARLLNESLQKGMKNLSGLYGQAQISIQKAQQSLTVLKEDFEKLKKLYANRSSGDLFAMVMIGLACAIVGCGIGVIVW